MMRTRRRRRGGRRRVRRARLRRPWAAAWPGRASRRRAERSSRRGRLAGGPPPMGTQNSPAETTVRGPLHPLRGGTPDQKGCNAYGSGAAPPITRTNAESARRGPGCGARGRWRGLAGQRTNNEPDRLEAAAGPAGPGRTTSRRAERSSRRGRRAGGQATRRPEIWRGRKHRRTEKP